MAPSRTPPPLNPLPPPRPGVDGRLLCGLRRPAGLQRVRVLPLGGGLRRPAHRHLLAEARAHTGPGPPRRLPLRGPGLVLRRGGHRRGPRRGPAGRQAGAGDGGGAPGGPAGQRLPAPRLPGRGHQGHAAGADRGGALPGRQPPLRRELPAAVHGGEGNRAGGEGGGRHGVPLQGGCEES